MSEIKHPQAKHLDDPDVQKKGRAGTKARSAANQRLINKYREEYEAILAEERVSRGLSPKPIKAGWVTTEELRARIQRYEEKQQKWEQMIKEREADGLG